MTATPTTSQGDPKRGAIPWWIKALHTAFTLALIPPYWIAYGPENFLWFSDIALFALVVGLWLENRLIISAMTVGVLLLELLWNVDFFIGLAMGASPVGLARYMFDPSLPPIMRGLSLFHLYLPPLLAWSLYKLGYDRRALVAQTLLAWVVLPATWLVIRPPRNINWVYGLLDAPQPWMPPIAYLGLMMIALPVLVYLPSHLLLARLFASPRGGALGAAAQEVD